MVGIGLGERRVQGGERNRAAMALGVRGRTARNVRFSTVVP
jgi:hypothetical protein